MKFKRKYAHMAIHFSGNCVTPRIVIQPRNLRGQFLSPVPKFSRLVTTSHVTMHGEVVKTKG